MKMVMVVLWGLLAVSVCATPTVRDLKVTPLEPIGVAIDYTVSGATEDDVTPLFVLMSANGTNYVAQTLSGETNCVNGAHRVYWNMAKDELTFDPTTASMTVEYTKYLQYCVVDLSGGLSVKSYPVTYMNSEPIGGFNRTEYKTTKLVLKRVEAGSFEMQNSNTVALTKSFYMGLFEVTQKQWVLVMGSNPSSSYGVGEAYPVYHVSYDMIRGESNGSKWPASNVVDASSFLGKLRTKTNLEFDLPTEAQWEYACRAGTTTKFSYGDSEDGAYMWYEGNECSGTHEVGTKLANPWGFYDMHGSLHEWCLDWYGALTYGTDPKGASSGESSGSRRVQRGGCWTTDARYCTSFYRDCCKSSNHYLTHGFRLSKTNP